MPDIQEFANGLIDNIEKVIIGKRSVLELVTVGLLSEGHILIDDVPGVGKTMLARSLARSLGCTFKRIQFTPDMLPSDVTGVSIFNQSTREFEFRPGPVMSQIVLADEINRTTPKTQSALLEAMQEGQITVDGETHLLPSPFVVLATQNPIDYEGTFPLPEAQLDRFLLRVHLGYPQKRDEMRILDSQEHHHPLVDIGQVASVDELIQAQEKVKAVYVSSSMKDYIVELSRQTRAHEEVYLGVSPRGSLALFKASKAIAAIRGRDYVLPDDIKMLAAPTLAHRLILAPSARLQDLKSAQILAEIIGKVGVPGGDLLRDEAA
jgi:MoxR-like ATPase